MVLPKIPYDVDETASTIVTTHARVCFDCNRYSVPPDYVRKAVFIRANDTKVRVLCAGNEIARHNRSFEKRKVIVLPEHRAAALARRKRSQAAQIECEFDELGPGAKDFRLGLLTVPVKPIVHLRRILELVRLYGRSEVMAAIQRALEYSSFDAAYIRNLIDQGRRKQHLPSPTPLCPKRQELIEDIHVDEPDPGAYDELLGLEPGMDL